MRFETLVAGEPRQVDGPFYGVKVLAADPAQGATLIVDGLAWPVSVLPAWAGDVGRVVATGPCILALATDEDEDLSKMTTSPAPPTQTLSTWAVDSWLIPPGTDLTVHQLRKFVRPGAWAKRCSLFVHVLTNASLDGNITGSAAPNVNVAVPLPAGTLMPTGNALYAQLKANGGALTMVSGGQTFGPNSYCNGQVQLVMAWGDGALAGVLATGPQGVGAAPDSFVVEIWTTAAAVVAPGKNLPVWAEWSA